MCSSKYQNNKSQPLQWGTETRFWIMLSCKVSQERWDFQGRALADPDQCTVCQMQDCRTRWGWGQVASQHPCAKAAAGTSGPLVATVLPWGLSRATASESSCFLFKGAHNWRLFCRHHCIARPVPVSCSGYSQAQEEGPLQLKYSSTATHTSIVLNTGPVFAFWASSAMSWQHLQAEERANLVRKNK